MKKNIKFIGAAAAALLAVAPVVASTTVANAATTIEWTGASVSNNADIKTAVSISGVAAVNSNMPGNIAGNISATYNGQTYAANLAGGNNITIVDSNGQQVTPSTITPGTYSVTLKDGFGFNFGSNNAGKTVTISLPSNVSVPSNAEDTLEAGTLVSQSGNTYTVKLSQNGTVKFGTTTISNVPVYSATNVRSVAFYENASGNQVTSGSLTLNANSNYVMNVSAVLGSFVSKYQAQQLGNDNTKQKVALTTTVADLTKQLESEGISVDSLGNFTAPKSFTLNFAAKSSYNNYSVTLPVTVNVPNGKETQTTTPAEITTSKTIMHKAYFYEKDGKTRTTFNGASSIGAYNEIAVVEAPVVINGKNFYKVAGHDAYINAGNIDGTSRKLTHNAYIYNNKGKRTHKTTVLKKGSYKTTYGSRFYINGKAYYRIGKNQYVKVANF